MKLCSALISAFLVFSLPAVAAPVTLESDWRILFISDTDGLFGGLFQAGGTVSITTTFETTTPDADPAVMRGQYDEAISSIKLVVGSTTFTGTGSIVIRDFGPSGYLFGQKAALATPSLSLPFSFVSNSDLVMQPNADLQWLAAAPPRIDASTASFFFSDGDTHSQVAFDQIGNYRVADVPVPGALLLFNSAFAALLIARRRFALRG